MELFANFVAIYVHTHIYIYTYGVEQTKTVNTNDPHYTYVLTTSYPKPH